MPVQEPRTQRVHFEGPWTPDQQQRVSAAVEDFEAVHPEGPFFGGCPSWVCVRHDFESTSLFCAHRTQLPTVLSSTTAEDLAQAIRGAAEE